MSASETSREDRQLPATEQRLQKARDDGQVARSRDLVHCAAVAALIGLFVSIGPWIAEHALQLVSSALRFNRAAAFDTHQLMPRLGAFGSAGLGIVLPIAGAMAVLMASSTLIVGGWNFTTKALNPKFDRLNPVAGLGKIFGWRQLLDHLRLVLLASALLGCAGAYLWLHAGDIESISRLPLGAALTVGFGWLTGGLMVLLGVCITVALIDVPMQIFKHKAELRMTLDEVKKENKEAEGDPHVKAARRRRQRELSRGRMLAAVPTANVIITNPTHYAVALRYDEATMRAPRIVAMGADHLAMKIRELGAAANVPMLEAPPLARALYRHGDIDKEVPVDLYVAVAQVLAWVFKLRTAMRPLPPPQIAVPDGLDPLEAGA